MSALTVIKSKKREAKSPALSLPIKPDQPLSLNTSANPFPRGTAVGFCVNAHAGQSWSTAFGHLIRHSKPVLARMKGPLQLGVGLWLSARATKDTLDHVQELKNWCRENDIRIFTINGFIHGASSGSALKDQLYKPDWSDQERLSYTLDLLRLAGHFASEELDISISTLPISYKPWVQKRDPFLFSAVQLAEWAFAAQLFENQTGLKAHLNLEPQPLCCLESSAEAVRFFKDHLLASGRMVLMKKGFSRSRSEEALLDKIRVGYDTAHAAVEYEEPADLFRNYESAGIKIGKIQINSALCLPASSGPYAGDFIRDSLIGLPRDRYPHAVVLKRGEQQAVFEDIPNAVSWLGPKTLIDEVRVHHHAPIHLERFLIWSTTQSYIDRVIQAASRRRIACHWDVETAAPESLPPTLQAEDIRERIHQELSWLINRMKKKPARPEAVNPFLVSAA